ncbi:hypothetical protein BgiMline_034903, partial [Biomphalaria glabrata]
QKMKLLLLALAVSATASANVIQEKRAVCFHVLGVEVCADPSVSGKREEDLHLVKIIADIGKVVHVIDGFISGATAGVKRTDLGGCHFIGFTLVCI